MLRTLEAVFIAIVLFCICSSTSGLDNDTSCYRSEDMTRRLEALQRVFGDYPPSANKSIDIILLLDRSKSVRATSFGREKHISNLIVSYLASLGWWLHKDYVRMSAISYGHVATKEFDGVSIVEDAVNACESRDKIESLQLANTDTKASSIAKALSDADVIFDIGRQNRHQPLQVLWTFFDGEEVALKEKSGGKTVTEWIQTMKGNYVNLFSVGIGPPPGGWMTYPRETTVIQLAQTVDMYACAAQWETYLQQATQGDGTASGGSGSNGSMSESVYVTAGRFTSKEACENCTSHEYCVCDVVKQRIGCLANKDANRIIDLVTTVPPPTTTTRRPAPTTTPEPPLILPMWAIITIIVGGTFIIVLIIVLISVACARRRRRHRKLQESIYFHPEGDYGALFAPPILPRRVGKDPSAPPAVIYHGNGGGEDYKGESDYTRNNSFYSEPPSSPSFEGYNQNEIPEMGTITLPYEEVVDDNEFNMPGWPSHLTTLQHNEGLNHLCVYTFDNSMWASGHASRLQAKEHKSIKELIERGELSSRSEVQLFGNKYRLVPQESDSEYIHMRRARANKRGDDETVWVLTWGRPPGQYMIIGATDEARDSECKVILAGLQDQLRNPAGHNGITEAGTLPPSIPARSYSNTSGFDEPSSGFDNPPPYTTTSNEY